MKKIAVIIMIMIGGLQMFSQSQNAISFDGVNDNVTAPFASALIAGSSNISITAWVYPGNASPQFPNFDGFAGFRNETDADFYLMQIAPANTVEARLRNSSGAPYTIAWTGLQINTWQHLALTYDGAMLRLYHNGTAADSVAATGVIQNVNESFYLGDGLYGAVHYYLTGKLDEVSLWNKTLSADEISCISSGAIHPQSANLKLYYPCNQGVAMGNNTAIGSLTDVSGNVNGVFNNMALTGSTSNFVNGVSNYTIMTDTVCQGAFPFIWNNITINGPGAYSSAVQISPVCDSLFGVFYYSQPIDTHVVYAGNTLTSQQLNATYQWVDCNNNYSIIPNATGLVYVPTVAGSYAVIVTQNGCSDTSLCHATNTSLIDIYPNGLINMAPNPFDKEIIIDLPPHSHPACVYINTADGKLVYKNDAVEENRLTIQTGNFDKGMYFVYTRLQGTEYVRKLVKN